MPNLLYRRVFGGAAAMLLHAALAAQVPAGPAPMPMVPADSDPLRQEPRTAAGKEASFGELDLLRHDEFAHASAAMVSVRVQDGRGNFVPGLTLADFSLMVNGTGRRLRLRPQGPAALVAHQPVVLLVFPPNQPTVHWIAVRDAIRYFGSQPEAMPWRVGIFDANGEFLAFTGERKVLLRNLALVQAAKEPLQFTGSRFLPQGISTWQQKAETAISNMARSDGPRLIIAMNPLSESQYGQNETSAGAPLACTSPQQLQAVAALVGAHIYIDNAGGPEVLVPGGDAANEAARWGTIPSGNMLMSPQQTAALNYFAYTNSQMLQTARDTMGGYANELKELGAKMERDLREVYVLEFDLTPEDQDKGVPQIEVTGARGLRMAMVDVAPIRVASPSAQLASRKAGATVVLAALRKNGAPILSPQFRIYQHVDYFPVRGGTTPVLPMSGSVEWTGSGPRPEEIAIAESVIDVDLATPALERELDAAWQARSVRWERDGELHPGRYVWLVAVHDASGKILSSSRESFTVAQPRGADLVMSSLVTGSACPANRNDAGLQRRQPVGTPATAILIVDPLRLASCRLTPEPADTFTPAETLRALLRLYPAGKLAKRAPEEWSARFTLTGAKGNIEASHEAAFAVDTGSGLAATAEMALDAPGVQAGRHVLELEVRGPGIRQVFKASRTVSIAAGQASASSLVR